MAESRTYDLTGFDSINISTGVRAIVTTGTTHSVRIEARDTATLDRLDVSVVGGRLHIGFARNFLDFILNGGLIDLLRFGADFNVTAYLGCRRSTAPRRARAAGSRRPTSSPIASAPTPRAAVS